MTATPDQQAMLRAYLEISERVLEDDGYKQRVADQPAVELASAGWPLPDGTQVELTYFDPNEIDGEMVPIEELTKGWSDGIASGRLKVQFAGNSPPPLEITELSEDELTGVVGGFCVASALGPMPPPGFP